MNPIQAFLINFIENPKSSLTGLLGGSVSGGVVLMVMQQAQCNFSLVHWGAVVTAFLAPTAIGGVAKDSRAPGTQTRATDPIPPKP